MSKNRPLTSLDNMCLELTHEIFEGMKRQAAITPDGSVSHLDTVVDHLSKRYIISGDDGTGKSTLVKRLMDAAMMRGFNVEDYRKADVLDKNSEIRKVKTCSA